MNECSAKAPITEAIEEQLRNAHIQRGMDASDEVLKQMAQCLGELSACDVPKLFAERKFKPSKSHDYGMRPGFCIDLTTAQENPGASATRMIV